MVLAPHSKHAKYGGFQKIAGRVSAIVSPLLFGLVIFLTDPYFQGSQEIVDQAIPMRIALASLLVLFSLGILIALFIRDPHERYMKGERAPYKGIYDK